MNRIPVLAVLLTTCALLLVVPDGHARPPAPATRISVDHDPYLWLEDVEGERQLAWVRERNARAEAELAATPEFKQMEAELLAIMDSDARIPGVTKIGEWYYNLWQDQANRRGLWRRTTLEEYRKPEPRWETVLDIDALNKAENENWVWAGASCLPPQYQRCLVSLSRGGADANVTREFDLSTKQFVADGFFRPEAKGSLSWIDADNVFLITDFGPGSTNKAGYSRIVKQWTRGTPMDAATVVFEGPQDNTGYGIRAGRDHTPGFERDFILHFLDNRSNALFQRMPDGQLRKVEVPDSANKSVHRQWLTITLREAWTLDGRTYPAGSLLAANYDDWMAGKRALEVLFTPTDTTSLASAIWTRNHLVLNVLRDVRNELEVLTPAARGWTRAALAGAPTVGNVASVSPVDARDSDLLWMSTAGYLAPSTLSLVEIGKTPEPLKSTPAFFDAGGLEVAQHFATSKDGTRVPYFIIQRKDLKLDGSNPTLLYGYGGFEISMTPGYSPAVGKAWLEQGGTYVVANIRGGGEYGPRWHQAALRENRHKAYEDFAAVAQDLIARRITSPAHLGIQGGSNGGLLTGNMLVQYPELFGAVVVQVPLLDMRRYSQLLAGASWMGEYGNPDKPEEWAFIQRFSPYHLFDPAKRYPPTLFTTSTRDDRVHPGHARKMMALMEAAGANARYYENIEGGHGGAADNRQRAHMAALAYAFLWQQLKN